MNVNYLRAYFLRFINRPNYLIRLRASRISSAMRAARGFAQIHDVFVLGERAREAARSRSGEPRVLDEDSRKDARAGPRLGHVLDRLRWPRCPPGRVRFVQTRFVDIIYTRFVQIRERPLLRRFVDNIFYLLGGLDYWLDFVRWKQGRPCTIKRHGRTLAVAPPSPF